MKSWLNLLKKLFSSDPKRSNQGKQKKKKKRWLIGRFNRKDLPALAAAPFKERRRRRSLSEAEEDHSKHALTAAIATAVAAEAALASAQAAMEVFRLTKTPWSYRRLHNKPTKAAIKIQTAFRGYLARKALRALKGLVRLQAIVRGQAVRRQVIATLNGLQTLVKIQSQFKSTKSQPDVSKHEAWIKRGESKSSVPLILPTSPPRRSFDRPRRSLFEDSDSSLVGSPGGVPNYMSATESARARLRSVSLPKLRLGPLDVYSDHGSPFKNKLSFSCISNDASTKGAKVPTNSDFSSLNWIQKHR